MVKMGLKLLKSCPMGERLQTVTPGNSLVAGNAVIRSSCEHANVLPLTGHATLLPDVNVGGYQITLMKQMFGKDF